MKGLTAVSTRETQRNILKGLFVVVLLCTLLAATACGGGGTTSSTNNNNNNNGTGTYNWNGTWTLVWSDEFNGADGSAPDPAKWTYDIGGGGWGNQELESYTSRPQNVQINGGNLVITAQKETYTGQDGITRNYTSARLKTQGLFSQQYGRFEARIKIPAGQGMWPAFWMLGNNISTAGWPTCGELDIMENIGVTPSTVYGTLHGPGPSGHASVGDQYTLATGKFSDDFHVFAVEWEPGLARIYVDGNLYGNYKTSSFSSSSSWVFDNQPMFMILNVAVGGAWPGNPDATTSFPQQMLVDYVRVYKRQ